MEFRGWVCGYLHAWSFKKKLHKYGHVCPNRIQTCPYSPEPKTYGAKAQAPLPTDDTKPLDKKRVLKIQQIVGSILYYAEAVDMTVLIVISWLISVIINALKSKQAMRDKS